ncbi:uncharacterized protein LOC111044883 [Nilaparvata lugens]|uniref:uncharacterized protein LOC111044883 n=1 Tax=Nilaparvata lugens TaxID=108931 RepID=UPI00193E51FB|nr:uncharacterized protein LOC111044883 [Nilaparvata lugens]XP_039290342.1 uncharacterized protein LOC111044883 [Nilaparvata lugens]
MGLASVEDRPKGGKNSPWKQAPEPDNGKPRPPIYNPEDYAASLRKMTSSAKEGSNGTKATMAPQGGEMTLRQFATVTDLLNKLRVDLKLAFPSFVQEFVGDGIEGVTLILELLRVVQLSQASHSGRPPPPVLRRSLLDEHACLQCLSACLLRCQDAARRLASSPAGLFSVAVCIMSSVNKSRLLALELLTKTCEQPEAKGHSPVSDAISTMRLRFGEPVRFRFLVGMMCGACADLLAAGLRFINAFWETAPDDQHRFYIQAELEQAGFNTDTITKMIPPKSASADLVFTELNRWKKNFINVAELKSKAEKSTKEISTLKEKLALLERKVQILVEEKTVLVSLEKCLKTRCSEMEREMAAGTRRSSSKLEGSGSTPGEDEGISSSDQDDDLDVEREPLVYEMYTVHNDTIVVDNNNTKEEDEEEETTIEEVMEELQNIINDAETDYVAEKDRNAILKRQALEKEETVLGKHYQRLIGRSSNDLTSEALILEDEADIVPGKLLPQPPRRSRSLFLPDRDNYDHHNIFFEDDESMESSDSLLSTSRDNTVDSEPPHGVFTRSGALRRRETLVIDRRFEGTQRDPVRRSETFHHVHKNPPNRNNSHNNLEMNKNLNNRYINGDTSNSYHRGVVNEQNVIRRGSFDGLFYVNEVVERPIISSEPSTKPRGTTIFINKSPDLNCNRKLKSKSLDRIGEGLDSMVDIVVTSNSVENRRNFVSSSRSGSSSYMNGEDGLKVNEEEYSSHIINNKGSAVIIVSRSPSSKQKDSDSKQFLSISTSSSGSCSSVSIDKSNVDKCSTNKSADTTASKYSERNSFFPIHRNSTPNDGQKFILKRGHTNAGLYSGQHTDRDVNSPANCVPSSRKALGADYYTRSLNTLQNVNLALSTNKLADLPSGLY